MTWPRSRFSFVFEAAPANLVLSAAGDSSDVTVEFTKDSPALVSLSVDKPARSKYSLEYLDKMVKASKVADSLVLQFGTDYPLKLEFKSLNKIQMVFILAPRVDTE